MNRASRNNPAVDYQPLQGTVEEPGSYQTLRPPGTASLFVDCFWQLNIPQGGYDYRSMPDACVDCIFELNSPDSNFLIAPFVSSRVFTLYGPATYFGVRFKPLGDSGIYPVALNELNNDIPATEAFQPGGLSQLFDSLMLAHSFEQRCTMMADVLVRYATPIPADKRLQSFLQYCLQHYYLDTPIHPLQLSDRQCNEFGLSSRQLRRLCNAHLGMGPKQLARVLRFQAAVRSLAAKNSGMAQQHFCDQSHMIREFSAIGACDPRDLSRCPFYPIPTDRPNPY